VVVVVVVVVILRCGSREVLEGRRCMEGVVEESKSGF